MLVTKALLGFEKKKIIREEKKIQGVRRKESQLRKLFLQLNQNFRKKWLQCCSRLSVNT